jgi:hypothetical protein
MTKNEIESMAKNIAFVAAISGLVVVLSRVWPRPFDYLASKAATLKGELADATTTTHETKTSETAPLALVK